MFVHLAGPKRKRFSSFAFAFFSGPPSSDAEPFAGMCFYDGNFQIFK